MNTTKEVAIIDGMLQSVMYKNEAGGGMLPSIRPNNIDAHLNGISDEFFEYWDSIKESINDLRELPSNIQKLKTRYQEYGAKSGTNIQPQTSILDSMLKNAVSVSDKIKQHIDTWLDAEKSTKINSNIAGLGFILTLPAAIIAGLAAAGAITALAYVATVGISTLKEYKEKVILIEKLEKGLLSKGQAQILLDQNSFGTSISSTVGNVILLALAGYFGYKLLQKKFGR